MSLTSPIFLEPQQLAAEFGSPLYVYDLNCLATNLAALRRAFDHPAVDFHYAIVCNKNRAIVSRLNEWGVGVHANTPGDAAAALAAGVLPERIVYSGTNLNASDLAYLLDRGIHMNLDSVDQVRDRARLGQGAIGLIRRHYLEDLLAGRLGGLRPRYGAKIWLLVALEVWLGAVVDARPRPA